MPPPTPTYSSKGEAYYGDGKYQLAINEYTAAIRLNPSSSGVYNNRGNAYFALGQYQRAIEDYGTAIKLDHYPKHAIYQYNRAKAYIKEGDRAVPAFWGPIIPGGQTLGRRYTSTYRHYTYYVDKDSYYSNFICCLKPAYPPGVYGYRDFMKAKEDLDWAIQLDQHNAEAWYNRGVVNNIMCDCNTSLLAQLNFDKACSLAAQFCNIGPYPHTFFK
jgi:tetratricopeptide (TPR) repeat protein